MSENKVKYNLSNVHYALLTFNTSGAPVFGTPKAFPGAVSLSLDAQGEQSVLYADNIEYWVGNNNRGYAGTLEVARVIDDFAKDILGDIADNKGVLLENKNAPVKHFALVFQFDGDEHNTKHVMYNMTAERPGVASQTQGESLEPQTETLNIKAGSIYVAAIDKTVVKAKTCDSTDSTTYSGWESSVYVPAGLPV